MPVRKEPRRPKGEKYLGRMENFLKSLRDLEEDLVEALEDLGHRPALAQPEPPEIEARPASANPWGWASPEEVSRPLPDQAKPQEPRNRQEAQRPAPTKPHHEEPEPGACDPPIGAASYGDDDSSSSSGRSDCSDSSSSSGYSSDYSGSESDSCWVPCRVPCSSQVMVNGTLEIPEAKPGAEAILRFKPVSRVTDWQCVHTVEGRKVVVTGVVEIGVEYVANVPDQPMHFVHFVVPFHTFFLCSRPLEGIRCEVEFKHSELLNPRTISKVILLHVKGIRDK